MLKAVLAVVLLAAVCQGQKSILESSLSSNTLETATLTNPDKDLQFDPVDPTLKSADASDDLEFDLEMMSEKDRPSSLPTTEDVQESLKYGLQQAVADAKAAGDSQDYGRVQVSYNPGFQFYSSMTKYLTVKKCCPRSWNYQCLHTNHRMPCFYSYHNNARVWCCPLWPTITVARCSCSQCAVLTPSCANEGRCQGRYKKRGFLAVCYRNHKWGYLRYMQKYVPTSCYCRI